MLVVIGTVGASIFITPADVLRAVPSPMFALLLWAVAGGVTLLAGLACAELGGMFPESGMANSAAGREKTRCLAEPIITGRVQTKWIRNQPLSTLAFSR